MEGRRGANQDLVRHCFEPVRFDFQVLIYHNIQKNMNIYSMYPFEANYMVENYGDDHGAGFYSEDETVKKHRCGPKYKLKLLTMKWKTKLMWMLLLLLVEEMLKECLLEEMQLEGLLEEGLELAGAGQEHWKRLQQKNSLFYPSATNKYRPLGYRFRGYDYFNLWGINCNNRLCSFGYRDGVRKASLGAMTLLQKAKYKKIGRVALIVCFAAAISVSSASSVVVESFHAPSNLSKVLIASFDVGVTLCLVGVAGYEACLAKFYEEPLCKCSSWKWAIFYHSHHAETIMTGIGAFGDHGIPSPIYGFMRPLKLMTIKLKTKLLWMLLLVLVEEMMLLVEEMLEEIQLEEIWSWLELGNKEHWKRLQQKIPCFIPRQVTS